MKKTITLLLAFFALLGISAETRNPAAIVSLVNRVCENSNASNSFTFTVDETFDDNGKEQFQIGGSANAITITGTTLSAVTCGLNWYLKHDAHVDICWNNLTQNVTSFPTPTAVTKTCDVKWRYYLNYCTFSYSMSVWDWSRWEKELDWMALHGVNLPLQIVGIDAVWYKVLKDEYNYSLDEINKFVADPMHQGWWLMNNLKGEEASIEFITKRNPEWWYEREAILGKKITDRMLELGMTPCLPGFVGMAPDKFISDKGVNSYTGSWPDSYGYPCPKVINITDDTDDTGKAAFAELGGYYYDKIYEVFGFMPKALSLDPFHERANSAGDGYSTVCSKAREVMNDASLKYRTPNALWVAQEWQINASKERIDALPVENTLLLDLSSERISYYNRTHDGHSSGYGNRKYAFCMLHNYGGNVGMYGCINQVLTKYFTEHRGRATLSGIGATPEGIETNPVLYELLFEMPWLGSQPNAEDWLAEYATCRYNLSGSEDIENASTAWSKLLSTVYNQNKSDQQGCAEPLMCIRPNKYFESKIETNVSAWAKADRTWSKNDVVIAARKLLAVNGQNDNYVYDLVDVVRQVMADRTETVLGEMRTMRWADGFEKANLSEEFLAKKEELFNLIDHSDQLLSYVPDFTLHQWVNRARNIVTEAQNDFHITISNPTEDANWLEMLSRTLITTWGYKPACNRSGLRDYGNREWAGLLKDMYKKRWEFYFNNDMPVYSTPEWQWYDYIEKPFIVGGSNSTSGFTFPALGFYPASAVPVISGANAPKVRQQLLDMLK